jgi:hypothetical protein
VVETINGDRVRFDKLAKEAGTHLAGSTAWTGKIAPALAAWRDETFPAAVADMRKLREEIAIDPSPDLLWRLAKIQAHDVPLRLDERQTLRALVDLQPDHPQVAGGEALFRLAQNAVAFREIPHAQTLLAKLKADFGDRLKVKAAAIDALDEECTALAQKLGYVKKP